MSFCPLKAAASWQELRAAPLLPALYPSLGFSPTSCKCVAPTHASNETLRFWESNQINVSGIAWHNLTVTVSAPSHCFLLPQPWAQGHARAARVRALWVGMGFQAS